MHVDLVMPSLSSQEKLRPHLLSGGPGIEVPADSTKPTTNSVGVRQHIFSRNVPSGDSVVNHLLPCHSTLGVLGIVIDAQVLS